MAKAKTIGGEREREGSSKKNTCAHCGERFGWDEFSRYILSPRQKMLGCLVCTKPNFITVERPALPMIIALIVGIIVFVALFALSLGVGIVFIGTSFTAGTFYFLLKIYYWRYGTFNKTSNDLENWDPFND